VTQGDHGGRERRLSRLYTFAMGERSKHLLCQSCRSLAVDATGNLYIADSWMSSSGAGAGRNLASGRAIQGALSSPGPTITLDHDPMEPCTIWNLPDHAQSGFAFARTLQPRLS